jgi:hypothetical protein
MNAALETGLISGGNSPLNEKKLYITNFLVDKLTS